MFQYSSSYDHIAGPPKTELEKNHIGNIIYDNGTRQHWHQHSGPEILIKSRPKSSWNQINQFQKKIDKNPIFCNFNNGQKSIFELGKGLKLPKMQFHEKKWIYLISRVFLPGLF